MFKPSTFTKAALAGAAGAMALGAVATTAQAQAYRPAYATDSYAGSYYDPCRQDANNRGLTGALIGGAGGAVLGSQFAASGHRRDGSLLGGILGAVAGVAVGRNTSACTHGSHAPPPPPPPGPSSYYAPEPQPYVYDERYDDDGYRRSERYRVSGRPDADGCTLAESPILMPDGRTQMHFVRVCMDRNGRYQVVN